MPEEDESDEDVTSETKESGQRLDGFLEIVRGAIEEIDQQLDESEEQVTV